MLKIKEVDRDSHEGQKIMKQIYELREEVYGVLGWIPYSKQKSRMIKDEFDESPHTTHFAIIENKRAIGSIRMVKYSPEFKLPLIKNGVSLEIFNTKTTSISEASRLVTKQDKKYHGCVLQLLFHSHNYTFKNVSDFICAIGNPERVDLYTYTGHKIASKDVNYVLDKNTDKTILVKGTPIIMDKSALNNNLGLDKYNIKRKLVVIR